MHPFSNWLINKSINFNALFEDKVSCLGILRLLPQSDQLLILQLLFLKNPIKKEPNMYLKSLNIVQGEDAIELTSIFKSNLREMVVVPKLTQPIQSNTAVVNRESDVFEYAQLRLNDIH